MGHRGGRIKTEKYPMLGIWGEKDSERMRARKALC